MAAMLTPEQVHFGNADQVIAGRKRAAELGASQSRPGWLSP